MKALIIHSGGVPSKTHRLFVLHQELQSVHSAWTVDKDDLRLLSRAAVGFRYPGEQAEYEDAAEAIGIARRMTGHLLSFLR